MGLDRSKVDTRLLYDRKGRKQNNRSNVVRKDRKKAG